jgi:unsaturated rhamnogalacturonyl hydrolase
MVFRLLKYFILITLLDFFTIIESFSEGNNFVISTLLITLKGNSAIDSIAIQINWNDIAKQPIKINESTIVIIDLNNSNKYLPTIYVNKERLPEKLLFYAKFDKNELLRPFEIVLTKNNSHKNIIKAAAFDADKPYSITYLKIANEYLQQSNLNCNWSKKIAESVMGTYPDPINLDIFRSNDWSYTNGFMINAIYELYRKTGDKKYLDYVKKWYSYFINNKGIIDSAKYNSRRFELDDILPGRTLISLYQETGEEKYKTAVETIAAQLVHQPRTKEGGFWHKNSYKWQMWLDGIYMADVFYLQYAAAFNKNELEEDAARQYMFANKHMCDPKTGLYYHGWDESKNNIWANPQTGTSPEFWARGIGWYIMALADGIRYIPKSHPMHDSLISIFQSISNAVLKYQDQKTGLWFQIVDKGNEKGNWIETSASIMFAYAFLKGYKEGILDKSYEISAINAFNGLKNSYIYFDADGKVYLTGTVKVGTLNFKSSNGSYQYYTSVDRRLNDFKGLAALLYLTTEMEFPE